MVKVFSLGEHLQVWLVLDHLGQRWRTGTQLLAMPKRRDTERNYAANSLWIKTNLLFEGRSWSTEDGGFGRIWFIVKASL